MANRNLAVDVTKVFLAFMVVGLHAHFLQDIRPNWGYLLVNGVFRIAVPLFLLINGYYLYDAIQRNCFGAWLKRVALLYLFWMAMYFPFWALGDDIGIAKLVHRIIFGYHHLWYVSGIIGGGIVIYSIRSLPASVRLLCSLAAFTVGVAIQYAGARHFLAPPLDNIANHNWAHRNFILLAFPFMCAGYFIKQFRLGERVSRKTLVSLATTGFVLLLLEAEFNFRHNIGIDGFDNLVSLALLCPVVFLLALRSPRVHERKEISLISSGIYFVHPAFLYLLSPYFPSSIALFAFTSVFSLFAALLLIKINARVGFIL